MGRIRRRSRTRRTGRRRYKLFDHLMLAGITGGGIYILLRVATAPTVLAAIAGLIGVGFYLGTTMRTPRLRSPIVWRRR
ncbi:hypothetical protein [Actinomadura sp. GTD37]|uniref:hypothetical protein n=1 Tax=Actinomadura sp. GTD37 TaxID=1778030 RepID=UPI0035BF4090